MEWLLSVILLGTMLAHGGFYTGAALTGGIVCVLAVIFIIRPKLSLSTVALLCFDGWYIISSLINGYGTYSMSRACLPLSASMALLCALTMSEKGRRTLINTLIAVSGAIAGAGILAFIGVLPIKNAVAAGRLQFPFEYANTLGVWFGAMAMLGWGRNEKYLRSLQLPILVAMFLTRSVGAMCFYIAFWLVRLSAGGWREFVIIHGVAGAFAAVFFVLRGPVALIFVPLLFAASWYSERILKFAKRYYLHYMVILTGIAGAALLFLDGRLSSAVGTMAERIAQIADGLTIIASHPIFGIGAGNWERVYANYQSVQYRTTVIHSGIVGFGVDAGIPAMALFALFLLLAWRKSGHESGERFAGVLILAHSLVDFDLTFFPVFALMLILIAPPNKDTARVPSPVTFVVSSLTAALIVFSAYANSFTDRLVSYTSAGRWDRVITSYEENWWLAGVDAECARLYAGALYVTGSPEKVPSALGDPEKLTYRDLDLAARAMKSAGQVERAFELYLNRLEAQPYNVRLFDNARSFLTDNNAPRETILRYNGLVRDANSRHSALGELMGTQEKITEIDFVEAE